MAPPTKGVIHLTPEVNEQCFLLEKADEIYKAFPDKNGPHEPCRQLGLKSLSGYSTNFKYVKAITKTQDIKVKNFFEVKPAEAAQMIHFAQVSETFYNKRGKRIKGTSIFPSNNTTDFGTEGSILQSTGQRRGAGIQNINITQEGIDSATKNIVLVNATFLFQDMRTLVEKPFKSLLNLGTSIKGGKAKLFRYIEFDLGWNTNDTLASERFGGNLNQFNLKLKTHLVKYTFDLKEDASVVVNAQYRGHIVDLLNGPATNILALAKNSFDMLKATKSDIQTEALKTIKGTDRLLFKKAQIIALAKSKWVTGLKYDEITTYLYGKTPLTATSRRFIDATVGLTASEKARALTDLQNWLKSILVIRQTKRGPADEDLSVKSVAFKKRLIADEAKKKQELKNSPHALEEALEQVSAIEKGAVASAESEFLKAAYLAKYLALRTLIEKISNSGKIRYIYLTKKEVKRIKRILPNPEVGEIQKELNAISVNRAAPTLTKADLSKDSYQTIPFIYLGDLMAEVMNLPVTTKPGGKTVRQQIKDESGQEILTDFGYMSYNTPYSNLLRKNFKLYYLPISVKKLNNFIANEIIGKERAFYSYDDFLKTVLRKFITGFFNICKNETTNKTNTLASPKLDFVVGDQTKIKGKVNYFIYGLKNVRQDIRGARIKHGSYIHNLKHNIYHFYLGGQRRGMVKAVKVTDVADQITKTAIYYDPTRASGGGNQQKASDASIGGWMPIVFQADITTMGFPLYNLGQLVYIDLKPFIDRKEDRQFKANGYYAIVKIEHSFGVERFESKIKAIIQYSDFDKDMKDGESSGTAGPVKGGLADDIAAALVDRTPEEIEADKRLKVLKESTGYSHEDYKKAATKKRLLLLAKCTDLKGLEASVTTMKARLAEEPKSPTAKKNLEDAQKAYDNALKKCENIIESKKLKKLKGKYARAAANALKRGQSEYTVYKAQMSGAMKAKNNKQKHMHYKNALALLKAAAKAYNAAVVLASKGDDKDTQAMKLISQRAKSKKALVKKRIKTLKSQIKKLKKEIDAPVEKSPTVNTASGYDKVLD